VPITQEELQNTTSNQLPRLRTVWLSVEGARATFVEEVGQFCISTEFQNLGEYFDIIMPSPVSCHGISSTIMLYKLSNASCHFYPCTVLRIVSYVICDLFVIL
jgi:hypothetical protein